MNLTRPAKQNTFPEDFWHQCFATQPLPLCILDDDGKICASNPAWQAASAAPHHIASGTCDGMHFLQYLTAAQDGSVNLHQLQQLQEILKPSHPQKQQTSVDISHIVDQQAHLFRITSLHITSPNGTGPCHFLLSIEELGNQASSNEYLGRPRKTVASGADVAPRNAALLVQSEAPLDIAAIAYRHSDQAIMITDSKANIIAVNPGYCQLTGYSAHEVIGKNPNAFSSGRHNKDFYQLMWHAIKTNGCWQGEIWNRKKDGSEFAEWITINAIYSTATAKLPIAQRKVERYVAMFSDITKQKNTIDAHWRLANFDQLTGLPNRRLLLDRLNTELRKANRQQWMVAVFFLDLDHFKEVNDQLGHAMGDVLLIETAQRLQHCVRETDTVARLGGDEFVIVMSEFHIEDSTEAEKPHHANHIEKAATGITVIKPQIEHVAKTILQSLDKPYQFHEQNAKISASIGIALYPQDAISAQQLIDYADQAMYQAKHAGKNRYCYFQADSPPP